MAIVLDVKVGESVCIDGGRVVLTVLEKSGQRARLSFRVKEDVKVERVTPAGTGAAQAKAGVALAA